jgi:hypothetical protein
MRLATGMRCTLYISVEHIHTGNTAENCQKQKDFRLNSDNTTRASASHSTSDVTSVFIDDV